MKTNYGEFRVLTIREHAMDYIAETPTKIANFWWSQIRDTLDTEKENFVVLLMNTRMRIIGHTTISVGILDQVMIHPREVFRPAVIGAAHSVILIHNHPSGDPIPSDADIRMTRTLVNAGDILGISVNDHVIMGRKTESHKGFCSMREIGLIHK
jgi:DNA repair protein RadC